MTIDMAFKIILVLVGFIAGLAGAHFTTAKDVSKMLGQLTILVRVFETVEGVVKAQGELKALLGKQKDDLNSYYKRLKKVEVAIFSEDEDEPPPISQM